MLKLIAVFLLIQVASLAAYGACPISLSNGRPAPVQSDALYWTLAAQANCPSSVQELKLLFTSRGLHSRPSIVANRGRHNSRLGSFSFFEIVTTKEDSQQAEIFFGHFTRAHAGFIELDQLPERGKLLVELIAWDHGKGLFNFYELIGNGRDAKWFYRGDSKDALADTANLHLNPKGKPPEFGNRMRCSGCHTSGGPIMKELAAPHNDWWIANRPLPLAPNRPSSEVSNWLAETVDASEFAGYVKAGIDRLERSRGYQAAKARGSLRERLRPLFCEVEINLESDLAPIEAGVASVRVPSASIVNPMLAQAQLSIRRAAYGGLVGVFGLRFPETQRMDADHAWLAPVKGYSDLQAIRSLITSRVVDAEFVADVLAVDMARPILSPTRCALLKLVPDGPNWRVRFLENLSRSSDPAALELAANLRDPARTRTYHVTMAEALLQRVARELTTAEGARAHFETLIAVRRGVFASDISKNPQGQILEPGFRVIFPEPMNRGGLRRGQ